MPGETPAPEKTYGTEDFAMLAHNYQVPMSSESLKQMADGADEGKFKAFEEYLKTTAQGLYPSFAPQIASGIPTAYLLEPYRQSAKQMLGENFEPDFMNDPKASAALMGGQDEKTGRPTPMTLDQWKNHIRTEPAFKWAYTPEAHARANMLLNTLKTGMEQVQ